MKKLEYCKQREAICLYMLDGRCHYDGIYGCAIDECEDQKQ